MSAQRQLVNVRDLVEEAKKRIVFLAVCVVGLSYLMSLTSSNVLVNLPAAASLILISVIQFIRWWNNYWIPEEQKKQSCSLGLFMSTLFYIGSMCGIALLYLSYAMKSSCALNIFFIIWTAVLLIIMMSVSLHSKVNRGLLSSGIMASYIVFLCWSAIRSEPANEDCNPKQEGNENGDWTTILGFLIAISAIVMATSSTGVDSHALKGEFDVCK